MLTLLHLALGIRNFNIGDKNNGFNNKTYFPKQIFTQWAQNTTELFVSIPTFLSVPFEGQFYVRYSFNYDVKVEK